jgi:hypothetical protein
MFGDPEIMPGGHAARHEMSLLFRCVKKSIGSKKKKEEEGEDEEVSAEKIDIASMKEKASRHAFSIKKEKVLTLDKSGEFLLIKSNHPDLNLKRGLIDDFNAVMNFAKEFKVVEKTGSGYRYFNYRAKNLDDVRKVWNARPEEYIRTEIEIINRAKQRLRGEAEK